MRSAAYGAESQRAYGAPVGVKKKIGAGLNSPVAYSPPPPALQAKASGCGTSGTGYAAGDAATAWVQDCLAPGESIGVADLQGLFTASASAGEGTADWEAALAAWASERLQAGAQDLHAQARSAFDRVLLQSALDHTGGHRGRAAELLGLGRNAVGRKLGPARRGRKLRADGV